MQVDNIAGGCRIPDEMFESYWGRGGVKINMGGGAMSKERNNTMLDMGHAMFLVDYNPEVVVHAEREGIVATRGDATSLRWDENGLLPFAFIELITEGLMMEGLLANLVDERGEDWRNAIRVGHILLKPSSVLLIADVLRADEDNPELQRILGEREYLQYRDIWQKRYERNQELREELPYGAFLVAKKGRGVEPNSSALEWGAKHALEQLIRTNGVERYAQHISLYDLQNLLTQVGFGVEELRYTVWRSRGGRALSGFILVARKGSDFCYLPTYVDKNYAAQRAVFEERVSPKVTDGAKRIFWMERDREKLAEHIRVRTGLKFEGVMSLFG